MVFSSLIFLYAFLPLQMICYRFAPGIRNKNIVLLVFSLIFYAWGEPVYVFLLLGMSWACWFLSRYIEKNRGTKRQKTGLIIAVVVCLGLLGVFKYGTFFLTNLHNIFGWPVNVPQIALPIGISFYTFQLLTYVVDVYRGDSAAQKRYYKVLLYAALFHQCIAGPIVRYGDIENALTERHADLSDFAAGINRFSVGLAKKTLLANNCGSLADTLLISDSAAGDISLLSANLSDLQGRSAILLWFGVLVYAMQIYLDFSAYSDMAIGMGMMIGFRYRENFNYPYMSLTVSEFWRRWHMSLGTFFRDYVYIPLGGNRRGGLRTFFNLLVVWALTGLWHGASWNFVLWGLYFFVFLAFENTGLGRAYKKKTPVWLRRTVLLLIVYFGWILFKFKNFTLGAAVLKGMFGGFGNPFCSYEAGVFLRSNMIFIIIAIIACTPAAFRFQLLFQYFASKDDRLRRVWTVRQALVPLLLIGASTLALIGDSYNPFLYFQF